MIPAEVMRRVERLRIKTKRLLSGRQVGDHRVRRVGCGLDFEQLRDYQVGDNVRFIDWKSFARTGKLVVRTYREDRNKTIVILVDVSCSTVFGSANQLKEEVIKDISLMLGCAAEYAQDNFGIVLFHEHVEKVIPVRSGRKHLAIVAQAIMQADSRHQGETSLKEAISRCLEFFEKNILMIVVSDCVSKGYEQALQFAAQRNEVVIMRVTDYVETQFPTDVLVSCQDPETGVIVEGGALGNMDKFLTQWRREQNIVFQQLGVDCFDVTVGQSYDDALIRFFRQRMIG